MDKDYRATPEQWAIAEADARRWENDTGIHCILELRARVQALEEAQQPTVKESLTVPPAPAGSLVEGVRGIIGLHPVADGKARAVIRLIAGELRAQCFVHAADWLEQEADR